MGATTQVEIDSELLGRLRARHPGKDDRAVIEDLARIELGSRRCATRRSATPWIEQAADELAARAVHEARRACA
jgi:hypothetical protein